MNSQKVCKVEGCGRPAKVRGLCMRCYALAWRAVCQQRTSWAELEKEGKVNPIQLGSKSRYFEREAKA